MDTKRHAYLLRKWRKGNLQEKLDAATEIEAFFKEQYDALASVYLELKNKYISDRLIKSTKTATADALVSYNLWKREAKTLRTLLSIH